MIGFILYEAAEIVVYGTKATINTAKATYDWLFSNNSENNNERSIKTNKEDYMKLKLELKDELRNELLEMMEKGIPEKGITEKGNAEENMNGGFITPLENTNIEIEQSELQTIELM